MLRFDYHWLQRMGGTVTDIKPHYFATSRIPRRSVQSSAIAKIGYSKRHHILEIEFVNGAVYRYFDLPLPVCRELMSAESKARFYDSNIKKHYRWALVRQCQKQEPPGNSRATTQDSGAAAHE